MDQQLQQQMAVIENIHRHHNYLCSLVKDTNKCSKLIRLFQSGEVDINMVLWPDTRFIFLALHNNNIKLLQFLLSEQDLIIDQQRLSMVLSIITKSNVNLYLNNDNSDHVDKHKQILLCLANCDLITVPILFMAVKYNWYTLLPDLLEISHQLQYLNQPDEDGKHVLDYACDMITRKRGIDTVKTLLLAGAVNSDYAIKHSQQGEIMWSEGVIKIINSDQNTRDKWLLQRDPVMADTSLNFCYVMAIRENKYKVKKPNSSRGRFFNILCQLPDTCIERVLFIQKSSTQHQYIPKKVLETTLRMYERQFFS